MVVAVTETDDGTKKELAEALEQTRKDFEEGKKLRAEIDRVMNKIVDDAKAIVSAEAYDTGTLHGTIRLSSLPSGLMSGFSKMKSIQVYDKAIIAGDVTKINPKSHRPCDYAMWVHDGHRMKDGRLYTGVAFLTRAFAMNEKELSDAIDNALKKLGKKFSGGF